jgi:GNAT superfamily N-acetyltransferase
MARPLLHEADVVLLDGRLVHIRPIQPSDESSLAEFHLSLSERTVYLRFFMQKPELSQSDREHLTHVDYFNRFALIATHHSSIIGVGRYDVIPGQIPSTAEVAFVVADAMQGRGLGSVLLEHLAAAARERGIQRFEAEILRINQAMLATFRKAGYEVHTSSDVDTVLVHIDLKPTPTSVAVMREREQRSERRNMELLLTPNAIFLEAHGQMGDLVLQNLISSPYAGAVGGYSLSQPIPAGAHSCATPLDLAEITNGRVDLFISDSTASNMQDVIEYGARVNAAAIILLSAVDVEKDSGDSQIELLHQARNVGIRILGPSSFGLINSSVGLNASVITRPPQPGEIALFSHSGALGTSILERMASRNLGISSFLSAGHRIDVSGNDALQYWQTDVHTTIIMLYLETLGNPEKLFRLARRSDKPIVMVHAGGAGLRTPSGHLVPSMSLSSHEINSVLINCGCLVVSTVDQMLDVTSILHGCSADIDGDLRIFSNSNAMSMQAINFARLHNVDIDENIVVIERSDPNILERLQEFHAMKSETASPLLILYVPPVDGNDRSEGIISLCQRLSLNAVLVHTGKTRPYTEHDVPIFADIEQALTAFATVANRRIPSSSTNMPYSDLDEGIDVLPHNLDLSSVVKPVGLRVVESPTVGDWRIEIVNDVVFGPLIKVLPDAELAQMLDIAEVHVCPTSESDVRQALAIHPWGLNITGLPELVARLSWLPIRYANLARIELRGVHVAEEGNAFSAASSLITPGIHKVQVASREMSTAQRRKVKE